MDTMHTPIVNELTRMSAHPDADPPSAAPRGPQTRRPVRVIGQRQPNREPVRPARAEFFTGGRS
jgi:hypothetical protein